jgi:hypothetical protein
MERAALQSKWGDRRIATAPLSSFSVEPVGFAMWKMVMFTRAASAQQGD